MDGSLLNVSAAVEIALPEEPDGSFMGNPATNALPHAKHESLVLL